MVDNGVLRLEMFYLFDFCLVNFSCSSKILSEFVELLSNLPTVCADIRVHYREVLLDLPRWVLGLR